MNRFVSMDNTSAHTPTGNLQRQSDMHLPNLLFQQFVKKKKSAVRRPLRDALMTYGLMSRSPRPGESGSWSGSQPGRAGFTTNLVTCFCANGLRLSRESPTQHRTSQRPNDRQKRPDWTPDELNSPPHKYRANKRFNNESHLTPHGEQAGLGDRSSR